MIKQYIKQALRMIGENKLLSVISILGTALAICMIMVIVILYVVNTASFKPEVNRGRTCYITTVMSNGKDDNRRISYSSLGLPLVKECCYPLKGAEAVTAINMDRYRPLTASSMDGLKNRTSYISYTDTAFWKIFQFDFQQGGPFSPARPPQRRYPRRRDQRERGLGPFRHGPSRGAGDEARFHRLQYLRGREGRIPVRLESVGGGLDPLHGAGRRGIPRGHQRLV